MHIALYRKYRPKTFSQVIGQKFVVEALKNQIAADAETTRRFFAEQN